jgi:hypothetical protein
VLWLWMAGAYGQQPDYEVVVAEQRLSTAREEVRRVLKNEGYLRLVGLGHRSWWISPKLWKPWVMVHDEGFARVRGHMVVPVGLSNSGGTPNPLNPPIVVSGVPDGPPPPVTMSFATQSRRASNRQREALATEIEPALAQVRDALWDRARVDRLLERAERLRQIWFEGVGPDGQALASAAERRAALVAEWLDTEPDDAGASARAVVEEFIDAEVQPEAPFTPEEIAAANAARRWEAPFEPR